MAESTSLVNLGELSRPATVLIEKVSEAVGGVFRPVQIRRVARAEADAERIRAATSIEISDMQRRAFERFVREEEKKQANIEGITAKALPNVDDKADPSKIENDWIAHFFENARLISDDEMQELWALVLAGEANSPGAFSKRTVNFLASLDKADAELFLALCSFCVFVGNVYPLVYDVNDKPYADAGITFAKLKHLNDIGLISHESFGYSIAKRPRQMRVFYFGAWIDLEFPKDADNEFPLGIAMLSKVGQELASVCDPKASEGFVDYLVTTWSARGIVCSSQISAKPAA